MTGIQDAELHGKSTLYGEEETTSKNLLMSFSLMEIKNCKIPAA